MMWDIDCHALVSLLPTGNKSNFKAQSCKELLIHLVVTLSISLILPSQILNYATPMDLRFAFVHFISPK